MSNLKVAEAAAQRPKAGPKVLESVEIRRSMDGGHAITHRYQGYQHDPRTYNFGPDEKARAAAHLSRHTELPMHSATSDEGGADSEES
jgi:hypothetical protein